MNRQQTENLINTLLASASQIPAENHREVLINNVNSFLNQLYPTERNENTNLGTDITTPSAGWQYNINFNRIGGMIVCSGDATNQTGGFQGFSDAIFQISDADYKPSGAVTAPAMIENGGAVRVAIFNEATLGTDDPGFVCRDLIANGERVVFNFTYKAAN